MKLILIYLLIMNLLGFFLMRTDKRKAIRKEYRIPEKILFLSSLLGGSIGTWAGMYVFHHKTKHWYFVWGMPFILLVQVVIGWILYTEGILTPPFN
ncbi:MAG: DUF1294 domain-containing protein [Clostridiales bacterium]|nr:DUF1294 domain-containing protein [Roseburia sp.]MDD7638294.1 DUF1294 domain-containing protein [Clostridiales bacterium]MDY4114159.1 DUF1294 domain-containing protein [Roseburia sp.]